MHAGLTVKQAVAAVEVEMGVPVAVPQGFDQREFGGKMINILWYSFTQKEFVGSGTFVRNRINVFIDGERVVGVEV